MTSGEAWRSSTSARASSTSCAGARARAEGAEGAPAAARPDAPEPRCARRERRERDRPAGRRASTRTRCSSSPTGSSSATRPRRSSSARARTARCTSSRTSTSRSPSGQRLRRRPAGGGDRRRGGRRTPTMARAGGRIPRSCPMRSRRPSGSSSRRCEDPRARLRRRAHRRRRLRCDGDDRAAARRSSSGPRREGAAQLARSSSEHEAERVVVGLPLTLRGERGAQAQETERSSRPCAASLDVPVETYDERFTTALARAGGPGEDARAAAHLLESYLEWAAADVSRARPAGAGGAARDPRACGAAPAGRAATTRPPPSRRRRRSRVSGSSSRRGSREEMADRVDAVREIAIEAPGPRHDDARRGYLAASGERRPLGRVPQGLGRGAPRGLPLPRDVRVHEARTRRSSSSATSSGRSGGSGGRSISRYARSKNLTPYDVLIIASMVEKEVVAPEERRLVAAVIYNRLRLDAPRHRRDDPVRAQRARDGVAHAVRHRERRSVQHQTAGGAAADADRESGARVDARRRAPGEVDYLYFVRKPDGVHHFFTASESEFFSRRAASTASAAAGARRWWWSLSDDVHESSPVFRSPRACGGEDFLTNLFPTRDTLHG